EHAARYAGHSVPGLGAYQRADYGQHYGKPVWGAAQARAFSREQADVIFGAGGTTGQGALLGAAQAGRLCIGVELVDAADPGAGCLLASAAKYAERSVAAAGGDAAAGRWRDGGAALGR